MPKRKLKTHLARSTRETWCGKVFRQNTGSPLNTDGTVPAARVLKNLTEVTCRTCVKADTAERERNK
jgi:hypothetical protein